MEFAISLGSVSDTNVEDNRYCLVTPELLDTIALKIRKHLALPILGTSTLDVALTKVTLERFR